MKTIFQLVLPIVFGTSKSKLIAAFRNASPGLIWKKNHLIFDTKGVKETYQCFYIGKLCTSETCFILAKFR